MFNRFARLGFFWGPRDERLSINSEKLLHFLWKLNIFFGLTVEWRNSTSASIISYATLEDLEKLMLEGGVFDKRGNQDPKLGNHISLIATIDGCECWLRVSCGLTSQWVRNSCIIGFSISNNTLNKLMDPNFSLRLSELMVICWEPEEGSLIDSDLYNKLKIPNGPSNGEIGWILYISKNTSYFSKTNFGEFEAHQVKNLGVLYMLREKHFDSENQNQLDSIKKLLG